LVVKIYIKYNYLWEEYLMIINMDNKYYGILYYSYVRKLINIMDNKDNGIYRKYKQHYVELIYQYGMNNLINLKIKY